MTQYKNCMQDIKSSGVRADTALLNALISALGSCGLAQDALAVFRTMVSLTDVGDQVVLSVFSTASLLLKRSACSLCMNPFFCMWQVGVLRVIVEVHHAKLYLYLLFA